MNAFPEAGRLVAHVMLDSVVAVGFDEDHQANTEATNLALNRINEIEGAVTVDVQGSGETATGVELDLSNVLGAAMITISRAVEIAAAARGETPEVIVAELREYVDR